MRRTVRPNKGWLRRITVPFISVMMLALIGSISSAQELPANAATTAPLASANQLTVERAVTAQNNQEKTSFNPGDAIWYAVIVQNSGPPIRVTFTWQAVNLAVPGDSSQFDREIFSDKNTVTIQTGTYTVYSPGTVPSDAAGPYWNKETVTFNGSTVAVQSTFSVAGGEACMFNAPGAVLHWTDYLQVGHVGWAFKTSMGDAWEYGATEGMSPSDNWIAKGTWNQMLSKFRSARSGTGKYTQYTCRPWPWIWSNPSAADKDARAGQARPFNFFTDNCLFRSVSALQKYGMTTLFDAQSLQNPNDYFNELPSLYKTEGGPPTRWTAITPLRLPTRACRARQGRSAVAGSTANEPFLGHLLISSGLCTGR
jgi:hypothetical protein